MFGWIVSLFWRGTGSTTFVVTPSGGVTTSGTAALARAIVVTPSGGVLVAGDALTSLVAGDILNQRRRRVLVAQRRR